MMALVFPIKKSWTTIKQLLLMMIISLSAEGQSSHLKPGSGNPILPGYFADPTVKKFGDTFYIYATTDGNGGGYGPSQVWVSTDFINWSIKDMNWPTSLYYWAPDVTLGADGKYYMYYCQPVEIFGASSSSPVGPWTPLLPDGKPIVPNFLVPNVITLDGQTFHDEDGKNYMYWGTWGIYPNHGCGVGLLNADMRSFSKLAQIPNTDAKDFFEAPFLFKRNGIYYLTYSSGRCEDGTYRVQYATSKTGPMGPFTYGLNNPILVTNDDLTVHGPGHQSVLQQGSDFYLIYHRHNNPHSAGGYHRQVAADKLLFDSVGNLLKVVPSHSGIGLLGKNENTATDLAFGKLITASSIYDGNFKAEYIADHHNGTLWKPKNNMGPAWIKVDLGSLKNVRNIQTQFEYATWYYQYKIDYSLNGKDWKGFADRSKNTQRGSPMVDLGNVKARFIRLTILHTEYPGLNKGVWNMRIFENTDYNPEMPKASKPYSDLSMYRAKGLLVDLQVPKSESAKLTMLKNAGKLQGHFAAGASQPTVGMVAGKSALIFSGKERMRSSFPMPVSLAGNSSFSVSMWVYNEEISDQEVVVSWTGKSGKSLSSVFVGYGSSKSSGAVLHSGWADMGYKSLPGPMKWHHIALVFDGTMERLYVDGVLEKQERKMLFIEHLRYVLIGGNEDGSDGFSGALSQLRIYDIPLSREQIRSIYNAGTAEKVAVFASSSKLDYGGINTWANAGYLGDRFNITGKALVKDVAGKIAVSFENKSQLTFPASCAELFSKNRPFTMTMSFFSPVKSRVTIRFARHNNGVIVNGTSRWQYLICRSDGHKLNASLDGKEVSLTNLKSTAGVGSGILCENLVGGTGSAFSELKVVDYALSNAECLQQIAAWKKNITNSSSADFVIAPKAVSPNLIVMEAEPVHMPGIQYEYLFMRSDRPDKANWSKGFMYFDDEVIPNSSYSYVLKIRDNLGNVTLPSSIFTVQTSLSAFSVFNQPNTISSNLLESEGIKKSLWDGIQGTADTVEQKNGSLKLVSHNSFWDGSRNQGPFVFKAVHGDFVAEVKLDDIIGLSGKKAHGANEAGLMVLNDSNNINIIQTGVMPGWGVGNISTNLGRLGRNQFNTLSGWNYSPYLQIQRSGNKFYLRGSADGKKWFELPGSPFLRTDFSKEVKVGLYHASYGQQGGFAIFKGFRLIQYKD